MIQDQHRQPMDATATRPYRRWRYWLSGWRKGGGRLNYQKMERERRMNNCARRLGETRRGWSCKANSVAVSPPISRCSYRLDMHCRQGTREAVYATSVISYALDFDASAHIKCHANYHLRINQNRTLTMLLPTLPLRFSDRSSGLKMSCNRI
jgi:hypothetical protein